mgnify:CR=1 FL=1
MAVELPVLANLLKQRFPDIGEFSLVLQPVVYYGGDTAHGGVLLQMRAPLSARNRMVMIATEVDNDPEWRQLGVIGVCFSLEAR